MPLSVMIDKQTTEVLTVYIRPYISVLWQHGGFLLILRQHI